MRLICARGATGAGTGEAVGIARFSSSLTEQGRLEVHTFVLTMVSIRNPGIQLSSVPLFSIWIGCFLGSVFVCVRGLFVCFGGEEGGYSSLLSLKIGNVFNIEISKYFGT